MSIDGVADFPDGLLTDRRHLSVLLQSLAPEIRESLAGISRRSAIKAGEVVIRDGEAPARIGYIIDGTLAMTKELADGRTHIIGLLTATDMYGRIFDGISSYQVVALTDAEVFSFDRIQFERILRRSPELERLFLLNVQDELDAAREWLLLLGGHKVIERLASFLLILSRRANRQVGAARIRQDLPIPIHIAIRRTDLARYLGTRPESISRAFHELEKSGALRIVGAYDFEILDLTALSGIAGHDLIAGAAKTGP